MEYGNRVTANSIELTAGIKHIIDFVPAIRWWMEQVFRKVHTVAE
jgi:hypothetical protein